jgi:hypothetical protein
MPEMNVRYQIERYSLEQRLLRFNILRNFLANFFGGRLSVRLLRDFKIGNTKAGLSKMDLMRS